MVGITHHFPRLESCTDLPASATGGAVQVSMHPHRADVELLAAISAVAVLDQAKLLEHVEGAIHGRRDRSQIDRPTALDQLRAGDVPLARGEHLDHRAALRRPAQAPFTELLALKIAAGR